jgi:Fe-S-cluster containining protein
MGCKQCGECCKYLLVTLKSVDFDRKWVKGRGGFVKGDYAFLPCRCRWLTGRNRCEVHSKGKPIFCQNNPKIGQPFLDILGCKFFE